MSKQPMRGLARSEHPRVVSSLLLHPQGKLLLHVALILLVDSTPLEGRACLHTLVAHGRCWLPFAGLSQSTVPALKGPTVELDNHSLKRGDCGLLQVCVTGTTVAKRMDMSSPCPRVRGWGHHWDSERRRLRTHSEPSCFIPKVIIVEAMLLPKRLKL